MAKAPVETAKPVYAIVGDEPLLQVEALLRIGRMLPHDTQRFDLEGETAQLADVLDELRSFAMFGGGKLVVVRNADDFVSRYRTQMEDYVASPVDNAVLVLRFASLPGTQRIAKAIAKAGQIIECKSPKDRELAGWIMQRARTVHKIAIANDAAETMADLVGADLSRLDNELAKLALMSSNGSVSEADIQKSVTFQREQEIWNMTDALASGNTAEAIRRWRHLVQTDRSAEFRAVTWLCIWLENVSRALAMLARGDNVFTIGTALKIWPRERQPIFVETAKAMGLGGVSRAVDLLAQIDYETKTGVGDAADNIERFILSLAKTELARR